MAELPLYKLIMNDILTEIIAGRLRPGDRIPSEHELCETYMVSSITAKNALSELAGKGYIIRQKGKGSFVHSQEHLMTITDYVNTTANRSVFHCKTIGLIMPSMITGIDQQLLNYIEEEISKTDYLLTLIITRENQEKETTAVERLKAWGASGLIIFPAEHEIYNEAILKLNLDKFPFVLVDRYLKGIRTNTVCTNNYEITKEALSYLLKQNCRDIVFLSPDSRNTVTEERFNAFKDSLLENDIILSSHNSCLLPLDLKDPADKKKRIEEFLDSYPTLDGIFCVNKEMTSYVIELLNERRAWGQYKIFAFDYHNHPTIPSIRQDIPAIARECVRILLESIQGSTEPKQIRVPAELQMK